MSPIRLCLGVVLTGLLVACSSPDFEKMAKHRLDYAKEKSTDIKIAVFADSADSSYLNGILLAVDEINLRPDKLLGRTLKVQIEQDGGTIDETKPAIRKIADDPTITAVLGHADSEIAVPASVIYERSQVIFIPPFSTTQGLTSHNFKYVFRMVPNAKIMTEQQASVARILGYKKMVILFSRDEVNREKAFLFEDSAVKEGIELTQNSSFFDKDTNYRPLISQFTSKTFDAVFIAAAAQPTAEMVKQLREMGINKPILGNSGLSQSGYTQSAGWAANNTIIPNVYRASKNNHLSLAFAHRYSVRYAQQPDSRAAQGYDSVMLLASAIQKAGSTVPPLLASTLHYLPTWVGVTGLHAFTQTGDLRGKKYLFDVWQDSRWQHLPAIHIPYLLARFEKNLQPEQHAKKSGYFMDLFTKGLASDEHKMLLLELAKAILKFKNISIIYEDTEAGKKAAGYNIIKQVTDKGGFTFSGCVIPFSDLDIKNIGREMISCYGKLSLSADSMYVSTLDGINEKVLNQLNLILPLFKSSSFSLAGIRPGVNLTLALDSRSDVDPLGLGDMQVYRSLLNGIKVNELAEYLRGLPEISINLPELQKLGIANDEVLLLSPDSFISQQTGHNAVGDQ